MKKLIALIMLTLLFVGCGDAGQEVQTTHTVTKATYTTETHSPVPTNTPTSSNTPVPTSSPTTKSTITPTTAPTLTPSRTPIPLIPTIQLGKIPDLLKSTFTLRSVEAFNGHQMQQITGWQNGFAYHLWIDTNHLMLRPIVGQKGGIEFPISNESYPAVINLDTKHVWIPPLDGDDRDDVVRSRLPRSSSRLGILITVVMNSDGKFVELYDFEGNFLSSYADELIGWFPSGGISPSGTKILIAEGTWVDLATGRMVDFTWHQEKGIYFQKDPVWSADETRVFVCCAFYGDASTGESYSISPNISHAYGAWVLDDTFMLVQWSWMEDSNPGFVPLFDPTAKTYRNLDALADLPVEGEAAKNCPNTWPSPNDQYVWVMCFEGSYLIDLATFQSWDYAPYVYLYGWSRDSQFALLHNTGPIEAGNYHILSVASQELQPFPVDKYKRARWHPNETVLAYLAADQLTLSLLDAATMKVREVSLPMNFRDLVWRRPGDQIALVAEDGSLWLIDYPHLETLEQLSPPKPKVTDVIWSHDSKFLSFISDTDIYIVDANLEP